MSAFEFGFESVWGHHETGAVSDQDQGRTVIDQVRIVVDQAHKAGPVPLIDIQELLAAKAISHEVMER